MQIQPSKFKDYDEVLKLIENKIKEYGFNYRSDIKPYTYKSSEDEAHNISYELSITGKFEDDIVILLFREPIFIDTGFTYKIRTLNKSFFGRTTQELMNDLQEAFEDYIA